MVHSMGSGDNFEEQDRIGARNFARVARQHGVRRIIYLGGLFGDGELSSHLASRKEVGGYSGLRRSPDLGISRFDHNRLGIPFF